MSMVHARVEKTFTTRANRDKNPLEPKDDINLKPKRQVAKETPPGGGSFKCENPRIVLLRLNRYKKPNEYPDIVVLFKFL
jgi:hypothetical protein